MIDNSSRIIEISLDNTDIVSWLGKIAHLQMNVAFGDYEGAELQIRLSEEITVHDLAPVHLVTLACLVKLFQRSGCQNGYVMCLPEMMEYLHNTLHLPSYFTSSVAYVEAESDYTLNLWKVSPEHAVMYSQYVSDYFKRTYFRDKDLSILRVVLDELYANIADHSDSQGMAYSFINYDIENEIIRIAFCDFGIGIKESLQRGGIEIKMNYIMAATKNGVSARSNTHNRGFGLDTVVSAVCRNDNPVRILSGTELLVSSENNDKIIQRTWHLDFDFKGTLIYFEIPVSSFEDSEYIDDFEF